MNRRHIPKPRTKPPVRPDDTTYKPFYVRTEAPLELVREIDRYFHTIKPDPRCKLEQLGREEAEALLRNPVAFRVILNTHFREHTDELEGTRQLLPLGTPIEAAELTDSAKDPKTIWATHAEKIAEAKMIARGKIEELDRRTADIRDSSEKLSELETALADVTCADSSEIERLIAQLSGMLKETKRLVVTSVNIEQTLEPIGVGRVDGKDKDRLAVEAKEAVDAVVREINSSIEQFNNALTESIRFFNCRISILKQFVKTFHTNWRWIRSLALIRSKDFPNFAAEAKAKADELSKRIEEQERELQQKRKTYLASEAVRSLYAANRTKIVSVNDCIEEVNKAVAGVNRLVVEIREHADKIPEDVPSCALVDGDGLDALIKLLGQSKNVRNFYSVRFRTARRILEKVERDIGQIRDKYQSIVDACETTEKTIGSESSERLTVDGERARLQIDAVLVSVLDGRSGLARLVAKRVVCPESLDVLSRLLEPHTSPGRLALGLTEYAVLDRDIAQQDEEEVFRRLKQLRKNPAYLFLLENRTEILERAIYGEISEGTLKAIVSIYLARRSCVTALEHELYGNAVADLLKRNGRETALIRESRIPREELVRMYMPVLGSFYRSLSVLVDNGQYLSDHAAKHAGYRTERQIEVIQEEVGLWERLRNGDGPLSLSSLGIKADGEQIRAHYAQVSRTNAVFGTPFLAGFGYETDRSGVRPIVFFVRDLAEDGLERHIVYTSFGLDAWRARWNTTFITTPDRLRYRTKLSLITPVPKTALT